MTVTSSLHPARKSSSCGKHGKNLQHYEFNPTFKKMEYGEFTRLAAQSEKKTPGAARAQLRQPTIANARPYERDSQKLINTKIMEFMGVDDQPFSVVEDTGFGRLLSHLESRHVLSGRKYFTDVALPELHQTVYAHIERLLKEGLSSSVSFTTDIWSSDVSPVSLLSLTAHWIDSDFHLHKAVLPAHTAVALAATFKQHGIFPKTKCV